MKHKFAVKFGSVWNEVIGNFTQLWICHLWSTKYSRFSWLIPSDTSHDCNICWLVRGFQKNYFLVRGFLTITYIIDQVALVLSSRGILTSFLHLWNPHLEPAGTCSTCSHNFAYQSTNGEVSKRNIGPPRHLKQGSWNYLFGGDQTMQIYGKFEGFPLNSALFWLVI